MKQNPQKKKLVALMIFLLLGLIMSGILTYKHFAPEGDSDFCKFGSNFDCGIVNKSPYSNLSGVFYLMVVDLGWDFVPDFLLRLDIPVSVMGAIVLLFSMYLTYMMYKGKKPFGKWDNACTIKLLKVLFVASLIFSLYLVAVEEFILKTWCIYCLTLDVFLVGATVVIFMLKGDK